ncbi:hypothetical protein PRVXT_001186 [Proteinivorax tanatarense]|uniref:Uncharacterized protein n=1 Tax=Proteinivorax tanatarense TaxID=1260629 RepID=A0AAU7VQC6_9FIRM
MGYKINLVCKKKKWANLGSFIEGQILCNGHPLKKTFSSLDFHIPTWITPQQIILTIGTCKIIQIPEGAINQKNTKSADISIPPTNDVTLFIKTNLFLNQANLQDNLVIEVNKERFSLANAKNLIPIASQNPGRYFIDLSNILS